MNAVIYARYSSDNQREESIEGQLRECQSYAEKHGYSIIEHYIDRAISARTRFSAHGRGQRTKAVFCCAGMQV